MRKCGLFVLLSVALSFSFSAFFSGVSKAASEFDNKIEITEGYSVSLCGIYHTWTAENIMDLYLRSIEQYRHYHGAFSSREDEFSAITEAFGYGEESGFYLRQSYEGSSVRLGVFNKDANWSMKSWQNNRSYFYGENVDYVYNSYANLNNQSLANDICEAQDFDVNNFDDLLTALSNGYENGGNLKQAVVFYGDYIQYLNVLNTNNVMGIQLYNAGTAQIFAHSGNITYPDGYEGEQIPDSVVIAEDQEEVRPNFDYNVVDKKIDATPVDVPKKLPTYDDDYKIEWSLFSCDAHDEVAWTCENSELVKYEILDKNESFTESVKDYKYYKLEAQYIIQPCHRYDSWPATPDYCYTIKPENTATYRYLPSTVFLNVNGDSISGSTSGDDCYLGFCKPKSEFKVCEWESLLKLGEYVSCHIYNFFIHFKNFMKMLFVPKWSDIRPHFDRFTETAGNQLGFLYDSFAMLGSAFNLIVATGNPNVGYTCDIPLAFFGSNGNVQLCAWRHQFPSMWSFMQRSIQAGISLTLVYVFWRKFNKMTGRDVEDGTEIEVGAGAYPAKSVGWVNERTGEKGKIK